VASLREAIRLFEASLAIDPGYVPAWVGLGRASVVLPNYAGLTGQPARELVDQAKAAARRALELEPDNAGAHAIIGWALSAAEWHWREGEAELRRARELGPKDPWVQNLSGDFYRWTGDHVASVAAKRLTWELDPLSANSHWDLGYAYLAAGNYEEAIHWGELCIGLAPHNLDSYQPVILAAARSGRLELMRRTLLAARQNVHEDEGFLLLYEVIAAIVEKRTAEARQLLAKAERLAEAGQASPAYVGYCHLLLGESAEARRWLQRGYDQRDQLMVWTENIDFDVIAANPETRPILAEPGVKELYELRQHNAHAGVNKL
jgi:tetratricopeptide (TPR) repeat protein